MTGYGDNHGFGFKKRSLLLSFLLFFAVGTTPIYAAPFIFTAQNEPLATLLCTYANTQDKRCIVSPAISGSISGNLDYKTTDAFFSFLENSHDLVTYSDFDAIYYYTRAELESLILPLNKVTVNQVTGILKEMRAYDSRYPLRPINNGKMLRINAPPAYVTLIVELVADLEASYKANKDTRVFRLKHAWAADVELNFMNGSTTIPGVASLLRAITNEGATLPTGAINLGSNTSSVSRLKGQGLSSRTGTQQAAIERREAAADSLAKTAETQQAAAGARILADPRLNAVIIWDDEELLPFYEDLIYELDQPVSLVEIRAAVVDVAVDRTRELGIAWDFSAGTGNKWSAAGGANVGLGDSAVDFSSNQGYGLNLTTIYSNGLDVFMAKIRALEEDGDASVLSRPAVLTLDNIQASLEVTTTYYIAVAGQEEVDLFDVTYGTVLRVTPHVIEDEASGERSVKLTVQVEDGGSQAPAANSGVTYPIVSKTQVNTQAIVGDGDALIVGGHYYETSTKGDSGIPLLKDLPLLGFAFKNQADGYRKQERLFIISPRLVDMNEVRTEALHYAELFDRTMTTPPIEREEYTTAGCSRRRRIAVEPAPMPNPQAAEMSQPVVTVQPVSTKVSTSLNPSPSVPTLPMAQQVNQGMN